MENTARVEQLGDYLVRRLVGEGGMGKVYEAEERLSKRRVALKVLHQELARSEQGRRLFLNEMQILAHLEHPNVVRSLASLEVDGELVMVLEYLDGKTLRSLLNAESRLPWSEAVGVACEVAAALAAAHGQEPPIIHRDLKPENIFVTKDGVVKVMDFGIAKVIEALNQTNTQSVGTLQYMSPEQIDAHTIDHRSDLYCLGLVMYEMIAGKPPFQSASPRQLLNLQCTAEAPPFDEEVRRGLPKGVEQLVFQLLEKAPEDRPYLAQDIVERLEPFQTAGAVRGSGARASRAGASAVTPHAATPRGQSDSGPRRKSEVGSESRREAPARSVEAERDSARARDRTKDDDRDRDRGAERDGGKRADTIALLEKVDAPREVPTKVAIAIVVVLSLVAGLAAYLVRSQSGPADPLAPTATTLEQPEHVLAPASRDAPARRR